MSLQIFQTDDKNLSLLQTAWAQQLNPVIQSPTAVPVLLKQIVLATGDNVINTKLGRMQQGWKITDINAAVSIFRSAPFNNLTLTLNSSGPAIINLELF